MAGFAALDEIVIRRGVIRLNGVVDDGVVGVKGLDVSISDREMSAANAT